MRVYILSAVNKLESDIVSVPAEATTTVAALQDALETHTGIPENEQRLYCRPGLRLERSATLGQYGLPSPTQDDKIVILFHQRSLGTEALPINAHLNLSATHPPPLVGIESPNKADHRAVLEYYKVQFANHHQVAQAFLNNATQLKATCERICIELMCLEETVSLISADLRPAMERSLQNHNHLASYLQARQSSVTTVATFEEDYRRLSTVVLHPSLQRGSIKTLKDLVASERLESAGHTWEIQEAMIYERHAENSKEKDAILAIGFDPSDPNTINHAKVKDITTSTDKIVSFMKALHEMFSNDLHKVEAALKRNSTDTSAFGVQIKAHEAELPKLREWEHELIGITRELNDIKTSVWRTTVRRVNRINALATRVRGFTSSVDLLTDLLLKQKASSKLLKFVKHLPYAYEAYLKEVSRRRKWSEATCKEVEPLDASAKRISTTEQRKRAKFAKHWAEWIPDVLIRPLLNTKPEIKIIANIFDVDLPEITVEGENAPDAPSFGVLSSVSDLTKMSEEIKRLLKENQELQDSQVTSQMVRSQASDENETLKSQIMALQTQLASSEQDKLAMSAKLEEIVRSQEQAEKTFAEREQVLQSQVQEKEDLIASTMTDQQTEMSKQLAEFLQRQDELQAEVDAKKRENADAKQTIDELRAMLEKARADLAATSNVAKEIEKLKAQHAEEVTALKKQMLDSVESHVALSNAQIELEKARQELIDHQEANGPMAQLMLSMSADMDQLRTTIDDLTTENAALRSASHQSNSTVSADLKASEKTIENLSHENLELKKSVNAYKVILAMFEDSIGILEESTRRSDQKTAQAPVDVKDPSQVTTRLDNLQTAVASLQSELDHLHAELDNTKLNQGIAVRDFTAGSLMQFIKNEDGFYEATQDGSAIRHFLDQSCFDVFHASKQSKKPLYGFLVYVDHVISDEPVAENFNLPENTPFCKVTVEKTQFPLVQN